MAEWYYIGHYGQLGPLTREQMSELIEGGVIVNDTYVWKSGMTDWTYAERVIELQDSFRQASVFAAPPPPPTVVPPTFSAPQAQAQTPAPAPFQPPTYSYGYSPYPVAPTRLTPYPGIVSDKSRILASILQFLIPGVGRMYLGYGAYGVVQLITSLATCGIGYIWSFIDAFYILLGGLRLDGYGRPFTD